MATIKKHKGICRKCKKEYFGYGKYYCSAKCRISDKELRSRMTASRIGKPHPISQKTKDKIKQGLLKYYKHNQISQETRIKMSNARKGSHNPRWKGGEIKMGDYWFIWQPHHPRANVRHYVKRSILIAEKYLGRFLNKEEIVHHSNCKKDDDTPTNLYIFENESKHRIFHARFERLHKPLPILKSNLFK